VAGALLLKILSHDKVHLLYIDTGLMRKPRATRSCAISAS